MKKRRIPVLPALMTLAIFLLAVILILQDRNQQERPEQKDERTPAHAAATAEEIMEEFARTHGLDGDAWPEELISLLENNPEIRLKTPDVLSAKS